MNPHLPLLAGLALGWALPALAAAPALAPLFSSEFTSNTLAGTTASSVEWTAGGDVALLNGGAVAALNGYAFSVRGNLSTADNLTVNSNLNAAGETAAQRGFSVEFSVAAARILGRLTVKAAHLANDGAKQVYVSTLHYRVVRLGDGATVEAGSAAFDYAGTGPYFDRVFTLSAALEAGASYRLEVGMSNLVSGGAFASFDGFAVEAYPAPSTMPTLARRTNFAAFQKVAASVRSSTYFAEFAVDGLASNFHSWRTTNVSGPHWLEVTYPRAVTLGSAHLFSGLLEASTTQVWQNFRLQAHDGAGWVDIPGTVVAGNTSPERAVLFAAPVTASRFRLLGGDGGSRAVRELALFPPNPDAAGAEQGFPLGTDVVLDLAQRRPAVASSIYDGNHALRAVDGYVDDTSRWLSANGTAGETLEIDLVTDHALGSAHLHSGFTAGNNNALANFTLQWWNGASWQAIPGAAIAGNTSLARTIPFTAPVTTSKVRLVSDSATYSRVAQLQFFPPREGGYPLGQNVRYEAPPDARWEDYGDAGHHLRVLADPDRRLAWTGGTAVLADAAAGADALDWQLLLNYRDGSYRLRQRATGLCLALGNLSAASGQPVVAEAYTGLPHQQWFLDFVTPTRFRLLNAYSGQALQPQDGLDAGGTALVAAAPGVSRLQQWDVLRQASTPKKGIAASTALPDPPFTDPAETWFANAQASIRHAAWSYTWGRQDSDIFPQLATDHTFNPMQWGNLSFVHGSPVGPMDLARHDLHSSAKPMFLLGYNEPDQEEQSNITVETALARWPRLLAMEAPLLSPAPASSSTTDGWLVDFMAEADRLGYRVDHVGVHWYAAPDSSALISRLTAIYQKWQRPVWLTEFSAVRWSGTARWTDADNYNFLAEFLWRAESLPWLARYSLFRFREEATGPNQSANDPAEAPRSNALRADGTHTAFGELYAGWDGDTAVRPDKAYHLHNKSRYRRVQNPALNDTVAGPSPEETGAAGVQWALIPGTTADTVRIVSTRDGRRLRFFTGTYVGLAPAENFTAQSEWRLVAHEFGWHFLLHPQTNQRLRMDGSGNLAMGSASSTGEDYQWRFVVPQSPEAASAPDAPAGLTATPAASAVGLTWAAPARALTYAVERAAAPAGPWTAVAQDLAVPAWTDAGLDAGATWHYRVVARNNLGASAPSAAANATTWTDYQIWAGLHFNAAQLADPAVSGPLADPQNRGVPNLVAYAVGVAPGEFPAETVLRLSPREDGALSLVLRRRMGAALLELAVESSADLIGWGAAGAALVQEGPAVPTGDGLTEEVTYRTATPLPRAGGTFFRLRVQLAP